MEQTFHTNTEIFGSPLNYPMSAGMTYCSAFPENINFGAILNSFHYRWTASCIANPEYEPEDMLKAVLQALASSEHTYAPFLVVVVFPVWGDSPWTSEAIKGHNNMSTLIKIPSGDMRFVPAHKQTNDESMELKPTKWPVEFVLIANSMGGRHFSTTTGSIQSFPQSSRPPADSNLRKPSSFHRLSIRNTPHHFRRQRARHAPYLTARQ